MGVDGAPAALSAFAVTVTAMALSVWPVPVVARADPLLVFPGMEIHQDTHLCTLGYVDPALRVAFTAGHCHGHGPVTNKDGNVIGNQATFRNNTPTGRPSRPTSRSPTMRRLCWPTT
ncbi:hypothetical protein I552_6287 [Mycobacterium xenopi 3993]|nr:hypothetical protein I552_6287 [Mycobacterium xenopi 3993]